MVAVQLHMIGEDLNGYSPCDRRSADSLRFVCDPQEEEKVSVRNQSTNHILTPIHPPSPPVHPSFPVLMSTNPPITTRNRTTDHGITDHRAALTTSPKHQIDESSTTHVTRMQRKWVCSRRIQLTITCVCVLQTWLTQTHLMLVNIKMSCSWDTQYILLKT